MNVLKNIRPVIEGFSYLCFDGYRPMQKSSIMLNRYNDELAETLKRPDRKVHTKVKGRVKALYTFRAQSYKYEVYIYYAANY